MGIIPLKSLHLKYKSLLDAGYLLQKSLHLKGYVSSVDGNPRLFATFGTDEYPDPELMR